MTVFENLAFPLQEHTNLTSADISKKIAQALTEVGLEGADDKLPSQLSGGMKKRAALARSIILGSKILFCDEPTSGLDPQRSRDISDLIQRISRKFNSTTVVTSHDVINSLRIADRLALIKDGKVVAIGTKEDLESSEDIEVKKFLLKI
jgi:ABC-type transport system involved in resistance to organic solvents, ATPase component